MAETPLPVLAWVIMTRNTSLNHVIPPLPELPATLAGRSIVLIGLMGAGKTSVGRRLAARLGLPFVDADAEIEQAAGCSVAEIFERYGEAEFREGERRVITRLLAGDPHVIATGGGAYLQPETRAAIRREAISLWLRCPHHILVRRVSGRSHRPLINQGEPAEIIARLIEQRHPVYAEADVIVDCTDDGIDVTVGRVHQALLHYAPPRRLSVALSAANYDVVVGDGLIDRAGALLSPVLPQKRVMIITDETVARIHLPRLQASLDACGIRHEVFVVPPGEKTKNLEQFGALVCGLLANGAERRTSVIALGGGVVGDLAGFVAASTMRGLPFIQIPTTLLSQVDSSVGGKTGVNTAQGKNLVGAFHQPIAVLADVGSLRSLPERELKAGYAEIVKTGLIGDAGFFAWCELNGAAVLGGDSVLQSEAVLRACAFKAAVVGDDERELKPNNGRALLNLGHSFAHALEAEYGYDGRLLHGEAVGIGLGLAFGLSARLGHCAPEDRARVLAHLHQVGMLAELYQLNRRFSADHLIELMARDKKMRDGRLNFVLTRGIGQCFTSQDVPREDVVAMLREAGCEA